MKAAYLAKTDGLIDLIVGERPDPRPSRGEVVLKVRSAALNRIDVWTRSGLFDDVSRLSPLQFPRIPGSDISGTVVELGAAIADLKVGDEVVVNPAVTCGHCADCHSGDHGNCRSRRAMGVQRDGGYAEFVTVPEVNALRLPPGLTLADAAAIPTAFMTAWQVVMTRARVRPGDRVLVHAAGSGVGSAAIQVARVAGARVFVTAGTDEKVERGKDFGAEEGTNYSTGDFASCVLEWTEGAGVDVIIDPVGMPVWAGNMSCIRRGGTIVPCGFTGGHRVDLDLREVAKHKISVVGSGSVGAKNEFRHVLDQFASGNLRPVVSATFPLEEVVSATQLLESRKAFGKVLLTP